jgi:hypothetical protein
MRKLFLGIGVPFLGVLGPLPWISSADKFVFGVPLIYAWIFSWFFLTSACLYACWLLFDRHAEDEKLNK